MGATATQLAADSVGCAYLVTSEAFGYDLMIDADFNVRLLEAARCLCGHKLARRHTQTYLAMRQSQ